MSDCLQSMEFSRPEYWSGQPVPSLGDLPNPGIEPGTPALQADSLQTELSGEPKKVKVRSLSSVRLFATLWTVAHQASLSVGFSRQEYWRSGLPFSSPGDLPTPKIKFGSPTFWADSLLCESPGHQGLITIILQLRYIEIINNNVIN